jgi:hypothetical protein
MLTSYGPNVDKKCVQEALTEATSQQQVTNANSKQMVGAETAVGLTSGGNTAASKNAVASDNKNAVAAENKTSGQAQNQNANTTSNKADNTNTNTTANTNDQRSTASATGSQMGIGQSSGAGGGVREIHALILIAMITFATLYFMEVSQGYTLYSDIISNISDNKAIYSVCTLIIMAYVYKL